VDETLETDNL